MSKNRCGSLIRSALARTDLKVDTVVKKGSCNLDSLRKVIANFTGNESIEVMHPVIQPALPRGGNFISDAWRLTFLVKEQGKAKSQSVIVKERPDNESQNKLMNTDIAFKNENAAYKSIIPALNEHTSTSLRVPNFFYGDHTNIILEDMNSAGFQTVNKKLAIEWNQIWSSIQEMARLHAASICMQHTEKEKFDELKNLITDVTLPESSPLGERQVRVLDVVQGVLREKYTDNTLVNVVEGLKANAWKNQKAIVTHEVPMRAITHGSLWINNMLFRKDMVTMIDLQHIVYSSPATDLSFFMFVNLDPRFFVNNRSNLLRFYLLNLHSQITDSLGATESGEVIKKLDYKWIDAEFRRCSLYGYMMAQWIMPVFYWSDAVFEQFVTKGGLETMSIPEQMTYLSPEQKDRIVKLTKLFVEESSSK